MGRKAALLAACVAVVLCAGVASAAMPEGAAPPAVLEGGAPAATVQGAAASLDVIPAPKQVTPQSGEFALDEFAALLVSDQATLGTRSAARVVQLGIRERFGLDLPIIRISQERRHGPRKMIWVVEPRMLRPESGDYHKFIKQPGTLVPHPPSRTIGVKGLQFTDEMAVEGYFIRVDPIAVVIHGASDAGSYWGAQTLLQLIRPPRPGSLFRRGRGPTIPCLWMADWPSNRDRVVPPEMKVPAEPDAAEQFLKLAARYKLNGIARGAVPADEAVRERLRHVSEYHPVPCVEKFVPLPGDSPLARLAFEAAAEGRTRFALAALAEAAWGPPDPEPALFRQRFAREAGEEVPVPAPPAK
ncbi:MAG TPA: glycoside hydrolase family 20 zincin-like fold domain-containing protein [Planctomycetota bacterium]|nr:glycoside hydrolase family 20 zincin-like fold domain-containing protein [Planctomycetota bacterium]